jgi:hypothetical protein
VTTALTSVIADFKSAARLCLGALRTRNQREFKRFIALMVKGGEHIEDVGVALDRAS